jgi:2-oxoisovalerate dehydrogenase E1 component
VIEARSLYQRKGQVALGGPSEVAAGARLHRDGEDVLLITWGAVLHEVLAATELLAARGVAAAVLDLRWLSPLDAEAIARAVRSGRGHVLVVHEANVTGGFGAEVAAHIHERHFDYLDAPVRRLGVPDVRMPSAPALQSALLPNADTIASEALALLHGAVEDEAALT